jgi:hypothetical protein
METIKNLTERTFLGTTCDYYRKNENKHRRTPNRKHQKKSFSSSKLPRNPRFSFSDKIVLPREEIEKKNDLKKSCCNDKE